MLTASLAQCNAPTCCVPARFGLPPTARSFSGLPSVTLRLLGGFVCQAKNLRYLGRFRFFLNFLHFSFFSFFSFFFLFFLVFFFVMFSMFSFFRFFFFLHFFHFYFLSSCFFSSRPPSPPAPPPPVGPPKHRLFLPKSEV